MERRFNPTIATDGGKITGLASPVYDGTPGTEYQLFDNTYERFTNGAFDKHLQQQPDVVATVNHDDSLILGRTPATLTLRSDAKGLHYTIDPPDTQAGRDAMTSLRRGDLKGSSFAFSPDEVEWQVENGKDIRLVRAAKVYDVSVVTHPAYGSTTASVRSEERSRLEQERDDYRSRLESEKRMARYEKIYAPNLNS